MRLPLLLLPLIISAPAASEGPSFQFAPKSSEATAAAERTIRMTINTCRRTRSHFADLGSKWTGEPPQPKKLDELPRGTTYMAAYRTINGCEVPLTMVEYRNSTRR
jgi:hypothetical protein